MNPVRPAARSLPQSTSRLVPLGFVFRRRRRAGMLFLGMLLLALAGWRSWCHRTQCVFPEESWNWVAPREVRLDERRLDALAASLGGEGCIVYKGRMVYAWGDVERRHDVASVVKPFYTHFTLNALEEGRIASLDDRITDWLPEVADLNEDLGHKDREISFRNLLEQTSGYGLHEPPGSGFGYNDYQTGLLAWILFRRVYACGFGGADRELLQHRLGQLQFEDGPTFQHPGSRPGRLRISARDLARFGHLYLMNGRWRRQAVLPPELIHLAWNSALPSELPRTRGQKAERFRAAHSLGGGKDQKGHLGAHSFFWWINRRTAEGERLLPAGTPLTVMASGHGGRHALVVIPEFRLVIVWLDAFPGEDVTPFDEVGRHRVNQAVRDLLDARKP